MNFLKLFFNVIILVLVFNSQASSNVIEKFNIEGNQRISDNTIILFTEVDVGEKITNDDLNIILNNLYNTKYFNDIRLVLKNNK